MINLALIGTGKWGKNYIKTVKKIKGCHIKYTANKDYLKLKKIKDIDGIIIATPSENHAEIAKQFPDHYLLVEKPFTTSLEDALSIKNKKIMVGHIYLYNQNFVKQMEKMGKVEFFSFKLFNKKLQRNLIPLWELASHAVYLCTTYLKGPFDILHSIRTLDRHIVIFSHKHGYGVIEVGYGYKNKYREIIMSDDESILTFNDTGKNKISPLETELRAFIDFIRGKPTKTGLKQAVETVRLLDKIDYHV